MNVMYLHNGLYTPSEKRQKRLKAIQELIHFTRAQFHYEIRNNPPRVREARIAALPHLYRQRWHVYGPEDEVLPEHKDDLE